LKVPRGHLLSSTAVRCGTFPISVSASRASLAAGRTASDLRTEFESLARAEAPALYRTARRLAQPPTEADDLIQETLLRAYRTFANFTPASGTEVILLPQIENLANHVA
jgi:Sigma-70 region 2